MTTFVRFPRCVLTAAWWRAASPFRRNLFLVLLAGVNWQLGTTKRGERLKPGQLVTSYRALAEELAYSDKGKRETPSIKKVRLALNYLREARVAAWRATGVRAGAGLLVTLEQWALYVGEAEGGAVVGAGVGTEGLPHLGQPYRNIAFEEKSTLEAMKDWEAKRREDAEELAELCRREGRVH